MNFQDLKNLLQEQFGEAEIKEENPTALQPAIVISANNLIAVCNFLYSDKRTYFDFLSSLTAVDLGPEKGIIEIIYHLYSIPYNHSLVIKVPLSRNIDGEKLPVVPSLISIWKGCNWQEREVYDMFGVHFEGHPDLRRILLPEDWEGFPLRKDYKTQDYYHGIKVD